MRLSDQRLEVIRAWLSGDSTHDPAVQPNEMAAIVNELKQLRLRVSSQSRSASAASSAAP